MLKGKGYKSSNKRAHKIDTKDPSQAFSLTKAGMIKTDNHILEQIVKSGW